MSDETLRLQPPRKKGWLILKLIGLILLLLPTLYIALDLVEGVVRKLTTGSFGIAAETAPAGHIEAYKVMLLTYRSDNGFYPTTEQGLRALIEKPTTVPFPRAWRQIMDGPILDPWQQEFFYVCPGKHNLDSYDIFSAGADRLPNTADDIGNWRRSK